MSLEIHPSIGIARLGASESTQTNYYFFAPEPVCTDDEYGAGVKYDPRKGRVRYDADGEVLTSYRVGGKLKRQAARFRIFDCTRDANAEINASQEIDYEKHIVEWTVRLANRKGVAMRFDSERTGAKVRRNQRDREDNPLMPGDLVITDGGVLTAPNQTRRLTGAFMGMVPRMALGTLQTDARGRLGIIAPKGDSRSPSDATIDDFANNDYWCDNTSDGPVLARVWKKNADGSRGAEIGAVANAWAVIAPFDFAPDIDSFISLHDICWQAWRDRKMLGAVPPAVTYYDTDVQPILERVRGYRWVNGPTIRAETQDRHSSWRPGKGTVPLGDPANKDAAVYRRMLLAHLRNPDPTTQPQSGRQVHMPRLHSGNPYVHIGDQTDVKASANEVLCLTRYQFGHLQKWAADDFTEKKPLAERLETPAAALDRISLQACSGGAFYPGMEVPEIATNRLIYDDKAPFRIRAKLDPAGAPEDPRADADYDIEDGLLAGTVTEGLAVPWQADFWACHMERDNAWWPATRPDHVFIKEPEKALDSQSEEVYPWEEGIDNWDKMVTKWKYLGVVVRKPFQNPNLDPTILPKDLESHDPRVTAENDPQTNIYYYYAEEGRDETKLPHKLPSSGEPPATAP